MKYNLEKKMLSNPFYLLQNNIELCTTKLVIGSRGGDSNYHNWTH
jgi:hypothetical protein